MQPILFPLGLAHDDGSKAFLTPPAGGIEAIELAGGTTLWGLGADYQPLIAVDADLWVARPEEGGVRFQRLDVATGRERRRPSELFEWPLEAGRIEVEAWVSGSGLVVRWSSHVREWGEPLPPEGKESRTGRLLVDPQGASLRSRDEPVAGPPELAPPPRRPLGELLSDIAGSMGPWGTEERVAWVVRTAEEPETAQIVVWSPPDEGSLETFELLRPWAPGLATFFPTGDAGHLAALGAAGAQGERRLRIVSLAGGQPVLDLPLAGAPDTTVAVLGGRVFLSEHFYGERAELRLSAFEIGSSSPLWRRSFAQVDFPLPGD